MKIIKLKIKKKKKKLALGDSLQGAVFFLLLTSTWAASWPCAEAMVAKCRSVSVSASRAGCMAWLPPFWFFFNIFITVFLPGTLTYWKCHKPFKGGRQVSHLHSAKWWNIKFVSQISQCWSALQRLPEWWCHCYHGGLSLKIKQVLLWEVCFSFQNFISE